MDQFHGHGAFANARGHTFGGAMTNIARYEDARNAGFQIEGVPVHGPSGRPLALQHQVLTGNQVTLLITLDDSSEPIGPGNSARINQQRAGWDRFRVASFIILNGNALAVVSPLYLDDTGAQFHFDILRGPNLVFQVLR